MAIWKETKWAQWDETGSLRVRYRHQHTRSEESRDVFTEVCHDEAIRCRWALLCSDSAQERRSRGFYWHRQPFWTCADTIATFQADGAFFYLVFMNLQRERDKLCHRLRPQEQRESWNPPQIYWILIQTSRDSFAWCCASVRGRKKRDRNTV